MLSVHPNHRDQNRIHSIIQASKFIIKGSGDDPSFDRSHWMADFKFNLSDGNLFHAKSENTHFVFVPAIVQQSPASPEKKETDENRSYFDPFERRARTVPGGENEMSSTSRLMFVYVLDAPRPDILKVGHIKFDEFPSITRWNHIGVTFLTKLPGNRLVFLTIFDDYKYFMLATRKNSLTMKVVLRGETARKEPILSLVESNGYLYVLKPDRIEVSKIEDGKIIAVVDASDKEEKTESTNRDYLRLVQTIHLQAEPSNSPMSIQVHQLTINNSLLVLLSESGITLFVAHIYEASSNLDTARVISKYYEAAKGTLPGKHLTFEVLDRRLNQDPGNQMHPSYHILVISINDAGQPLKFTIPFCLPNFILHHSSEASVCKKVGDETSNHYSLGFQNNEMYRCESNVEGLQLQRAYSCINQTGIAVFALESDQLRHETDCLGGDAQACPTTYRIAAKNPGCQLVTDCFNCSMIPKCRWNNELHVCDGFFSSNSTEKSETFKQYMSSVGETGIEALDYSSIKLSLDCPKSTDLKVESHHSKEYFNVSLDPLTDDQYSLVVAFSHGEQRLFCVFRYRRAERKPAVQNQDRPVQRHHTSRRQPKSGVHPQTREGIQSDELQLEEVICHNPGRQKKCRYSTS